jgi:hypothetical protein
MWLVWGLPIEREARRLAGFVGERVGDWTSEPLSSGSKSTAAEFGRAWEDFYSIDVTECRVEFNALLASTLPVS